MTILWLIIIAVVLLFGGVVFFGAPYLPTRRAQGLQALDLLQLKPGQRLLELGCGDGAVLMLAAERGLKVTGIELNPLLVLIAIVRTRRYRKLVRVRWGNFWWRTWPDCDGIYVFLLDKYMIKLDKKIVQTKMTPVKVVSYTFQIPHKKVAKQTGALFLYQY
jgi:SAM-dependent methyltransferase